jgi:AraC family transcriptional regulator
VVVFRLKTRRLEVSPHPHAESFSVKTVFSGLERYHFEDREVGVAPREALLVAPGRTYGSAIRSAEVTDSFSIFFPERWFQEQIGGTGVGPVLRLLDAGASSASLPLTADIADAIRDLARALDRTDGDPLASQEILAAVTARLFGFVQASGETADRIDAALPSTRLELLRRVSRVRDLLEGRVEAGVTLTELAREACLSEFHLLRVFKQAFGVTPARYLDGLRMERARALLLRTDRPVTEVAAACGFASPSAFGRAFRRRWGISATSLRQTRSDASLDEVS